MFVRAFVLLLITAIACVPQLLMGDWRGTEGRRVMIAMEMAESGNWMVPMLGGEPSLTKPPLHYWLIAGSQRLFGDHLWAARMPAMLGLYLVALSAMVLLRRWYGAAVGWVGALGIVCAPLALFEWANAEIDPLFAGLTASSLFCLATGVARERVGLVLLAGLLGGLALLQKGPPYFVFAAGAYVVWWRRRGLRFALRYFAPLLLLPLCYYVPLWLWWVTPSELLEIAQNETIGRLARFEWRHITATPEFWLRAAAVQLPFVLWCFWEWRGARDARMDASDLTLRMCSGAAVLAVVILTFFPGRPTRYLLPNVPLFIFAVSPAVAHFASQQRELGSFSRQMLRVIGVAGAIGLVAMPLLVDRLGLAIAGVMLVAALGAAVVHTPRGLVTFVLVLPLVAAWTAGLDRSLEWPNDPRARGATGAVLRLELERWNATQDLQSYGHIDSKLLLGGGLSVAGDEMCRSTPEARWLLSERGGLLGEFPPGYVDRMWIATRDYVVALHERVPR